MDSEQWNEHRFEILLRLSSFHGLRKAPQSNVEELLNDLIADDTFTAGQRFANQLIGQFGLAGCTVVKGINEDIGVEEEAGILLGDHLSGIHLVASEFSVAVYVVQLLHEDVEALFVSRACGEVRKPFAKGGVQRGVLGAGDGASLFDQVFVGAEGDIFHTRIVYARVVLHEGLSVFNRRSR